GQDGDAAVGDDGEPLTGCVLGHDHPFTSGARARVGCGIVAPSISSSHEDGSTSVEVSTLRSEAGAVFSMSCPTGATATSTTTALTLSVPPASRARPTSRWAASCG